MKKRMLSLGCLAVFLFAPLCWAEDPTKDEPSITTMEEVVVSATKTKEQRKDIPNSVIIKDSIDIEGAPATTLGELLASELGIDWRTRGDYGGAAQEIRIRGMNADGTQIFVNGINVNSPSIGSADVSGIPLNNIDRIEVVKGSGSLLYGTGAMGGTVHVITKRPERDKMLLKAKAGYGSEKNYELSAEQGMFAFGDFGYYLTATRRETDGFRDNSDLTHNDVSINLVFDKGDAMDISLYGDYIDREYGRPGVKPPAGTSDFVVNGVKLYNGEAANLLNSGSEENGHVVLKLKSKPLDWLSYSLKGDYADMVSYDNNRYYSAAPLGLPGSKTWVTNKVLGAEGNVNIEPLKAVGLLLGYEYRDYDWENENVSLDATGVEIASTRTTADADLHTKGAFAEAQYRPCKYLKMLAGIRSEDHSTFGAENIPRFGLIINPLENTALKLNHGKHFKAPTPNDLFWPYEDWGWGTGAQGNPNLKPEIGWHTDVTAEQTLINNKLFLTLSYFNWDIDDKIRWAPDANFFYRPENLDRYSAEGWEVGTKLGPIYNLTLALNYTYTDAKESKTSGLERQALYTPKQHFKGDLTYWFDFGLTVTATVRYMDERPGYYASDTNSTV
ncbi:MAG: TonB-dependent receptor [Desulfobacterales bacterium]|uniref:TonB-dependent receptor n=1 Tax=Candidatus Desulfatibia vada TaxID=2841696 RepID=A0A8J6TUM2_9BACT|nr:TonB-dependent receptor [Candidatus Desulfatibia vada]MBL6970760.1 TonB-dependent receptor [Desulfobacterales bacterium]